MNKGRTIFAQVMDHIPVQEFQKCVIRYGGGRNERGFSCWDQFLCLAFAQLTYRESLRDIEACLRSVGSKLYHMGFRGKVSRSTLADANETHDWRIYADFAQVLIHTARPMYASESLVLISTTRYMPWTPPPSISVCPCSPGHDFDPGRVPSRCTRYSIFAARSLLSLRFPMEKWPTSRSSIASCRNLMRST